MLICEDHKAEPGKGLCKHGVGIVTTDDLSPDIDNLEISGYQDEANADNSDAGNQEVVADQQFLAYVTPCKLLPSSDIQWVLATQQSQKIQKLMQKDPGKTKKIDDVIYGSSVHNHVYFTNKH